VAASVALLPLASAPGCGLVAGAALSATVNAVSITGAVCWRTDKFNGRVRGASASTGKAWATAPDAALSRHKEKRKDRVFMVFVFG
jgi:type IV secretory pathway VirB6-like protein